MRSASRKPSKSGYRVAAFSPLGPENTMSVFVKPGVYAARYCFMDKTSGMRTSFVNIPVDGVALSVENGGADETKVPARKKAA